MELYLPEEHFCPASKSLKHVGIKMHSGNRIYDAEPPSLFRDCHRATTPAKTQSARIPGVIKDRKLWLRTNRTTFQSAQGNTPSMSKLMVSSIQRGIGV